MREIKFRVWDKQYKEYGQPFTKFVTAEDGNEFEFMAFKFSYGIISLSDALKNPNRYITEQFTDLKDKNGKEIYKGDIIEFQPTDKPERAAIEFQTHCYNAGFYPNESANANCYWEVIGNIHEKPELLEANNVKLNG